MLNIFDSQLWTLFNPLKGWTLHGLKLREAQLLVSTLNMAEQSVTLVWRTDWSAWQYLKSESCRDLFLVPKSKGTLPPEVPVGMLQESEEEITQVRPVMSQKKSIIDRKHVRYGVCIECEIIVGENSFVTTTKDISTGGFYFTDPLPEWVAGYFTVLIKCEPNLEVTCMMVENQKKEKFRAEIVDSNSHETIDSLGAWLEGSGFPTLD